MTFWIGFVVGCFSGPIIAAVLLVFGTMRLGGKLDDLDWRRRRHSGMNGSQSARTAASSQAEPSGRRDRLSVVEDDRPASPHDGIGFRP